MKGIMREIMEMMKMMKIMIKKYILIINKSNKIKPK